MIILLICLLISCAHTRQIIIKDYHIYSSLDHDMLVRMGGYISPENFTIPTFSEIASEALAKRAYKYIAKHTGYNFSNSELSHFPESQNNFDPYIINILGYNISIPDIRDIYYKEDPVTLYRVVRGGGFIKPVELISDKQRHSNIMVLSYIVNVYKIVCVRSSLILGWCHEYDKRIDHAFVYTDYNIFENNTSFNTSQYKTITNMFFVKYNGYSHDIEYVSTLNESGHEQGTNEIFDSDSEEYTITFNF